MASPTDVAQATVGANYIRAILTREREHGTIDHLLVMPVTPFEIAISKVLANALIVFAAFTGSLLIVVRSILEVPIAGSIPLFLAGTLMFVFAAAAIGILLATAARTMAQFALLVIITVLPMMILSGGMSPVESQPQWLQYVTLFLPSRHYLSFSNAVLFRGAGFDTVWPAFCLVAGLGIVFLTTALLVFRRAMVGTS